MLDFPEAENRARSVSYPSSCHRLVPGPIILSFLVGFVVLRLGSSGLFQGGLGRRRIR